MRRKFLYGLIALCCSAAMYGQQAIVTTGQELTAATGEHMSVSIGQIPFIISPQKENENVRIVSGVQQPFYYQISFVNWNEKEQRFDTLHKKMCEYGEPIIYPGPTPSAPLPTAKYTYKFAGWEPELKEGDIVTGPVTYVAQFTAEINEYTVRLLVEPDTLDNDVCISNLAGLTDSICFLNNHECIGTFKYNDEQPIRISAYSDPCYSFVGWYRVYGENQDKEEILLDEGNVDNNIPIYVTGDTTILAKFKRNEYTVTVDVDGPKHETPTQFHEKCGERITFSASAYEDYHFVGWSDGDTDSVRTVEVIANTTYIAYYEPNCGEYANFPIESEYDWLLMLNLNKINSKGYYFPPEKVIWYRVTGEPDDISQDILGDDVVMGTGYYLTIDRNLKNTGDYYAVVDVSSGADGQLCYGLMRSQLVHYANNASGQDEIQYTPRLVPNMVGQGQVMQIQDLNPDVQSNVSIYASSGQLVRSITGISQPTCDVLADQLPGCYLIVVQMGDELTTLRYIVVR